MNIIEYINTKLHPKESTLRKSTLRKSTQRVNPSFANTDFAKIISFYEKTIFNAYKNDSKYTKPFCVPLSIIDNLQQKYVDTYAGETDAG